MLLLDGTYQITNADNSNITVLVKCDPGHHKSKGEITYRPIAYFSSMFTALRFVLQRELNFSTNYNDFETAVDLCGQFAVISNRIDTMLETIQQHYNKVAV